MKRDDKNARNGTSRMILSFMCSNVCGPRANLSVDGLTAGTPISVTQALSDLRLSHARLLEEHGATVALLRVREARVMECEHQESELQETVALVQKQLRLAEETVARREMRAALAEREAGFLQALLATYDTEQEAGVSAEARMDRTKVQQIEELQKLLEDYKERNRQLEKDVDALGGNSLFAGRSKQELSQAIEKERAEKLSLQKGLLIILCFRSTNLSFWQT